MLPVLFMDARALATLSDEDLVIQFQTTGVQAYFEELWRRHSRTIHVRCYGFVGDLAIAEDLTSETFLKARRMIDGYKTGRFEGWLYAIARTICLNHLQKAYVRREQGQTEDEWLVMSNTEDDPTPEALALAAQVKGFINQLSPKQRVAVKLYYLEGFSYDEIAAEMGEPSRAVKSYLQNGLRNLRNFCEGQGAGK